MTWIHGPSVRRGVCVGLLLAGCAGETTVPFDGATPMDTNVDDSHVVIDVGTDTGSVDAFVRPDTGGCAFAPDGDGDNHRAIACGGDDCDDGDSNRYPGNTEVCDTNNHDEDCDPTTFGVRDADADGFPDAHCCNMSSTGPLACGTDCDDTRASAHPTSVEVCNSLDDDCDTAIDEGVTVDFWVDADHDGHGTHDTATMMQGCPGMAPAGYAEADDDCDDTRSYVHPGLPESCDFGADGMAHDENCDTQVDEGCMCIGSMSRPCSDPMVGAVGACAAGTETCVGGRFSTCSITPQTEVCNMSDDDCDGMTDESTTAVCYPDADGDTYAVMGAAGTSTCQVPNRVAVGGCPSLTTNRMPATGAIDCNDNAQSISPAGMEGTVCNHVDDDCNGTVDDGLTFPCFADNDDDGYALAGTPVVQVCPDPTRGVRGFCPFRMTNRPPSTGMIDCDDSTGMGAIDFPGAPEVCDSVDNDCDTRVDETTMVSCYHDGDNDTYAPSTATAMSVCRVIGRDAYGGCPLNSTFRTPASAVDCDDANPLRYTGAIEQCNSVDDDCDMTIDEGSRVLCYVDLDNDTYPPSGASSTMACADASRTMVNGCPLNSTNRAPSATATMNDCRDGDMASHPGATEVCDNIDNDCDGAIDNGVPRVTCYTDMDDDNLAPSGATASMFCPDASRATHGNCPTSFTGNAPTASQYDCSDADAARHWANVTCWRDDDHDGYACPTMDGPNYDCRAGGAGSMMTASISLCPLSASMCDSGYTSLDPGTGPAMSLVASDCNDSSTGGGTHTWIPCYTDADNDGYILNNTTIAGYGCSGVCPALMRPGSAPIDCNDSNMSVHTNLTCYRDADGDGYAGTLINVCALTCGSYATTSPDCCDTDNRAHPGQTVAQVTARTGCNGGFDFNCNNVETRSLPTTASLSCGPPDAGGDCSSTGSPGWSSGVAACGTSATYVTDCFPVNTHVCSRETDTLTQSCL